MTPQQVYRHTRWWYKCDAPTLYCIVDDEPLPSGKTRERWVLTPDYVRLDTWDAETL